MNDANFYASRFPQIIDDGLNILSRRSHDHKDGIRLFTIMFGDQSVVASGELAIFFTGLLVKGQNIFGKIIPAGRHAVHIMFLILNRTQHHRMFKVDHRRDTPPCRAE
jgi:hypothetical protein